MFKTCLLAAAVLTFQAAACLAANTEGVSGGQFLRIGVGAESAALGETGAVGSGAQSMFYNPAGLASVAGSEIYLSQVQWIMETSYSNLAAAKKIGGGVLGLSVSRLGMPSTNKYDRLGNKLSDTYTATDMSAALGYGHALWSGASLGLTLKYITSEIDDENATAMAADAGIKWALVPGKLDFGAVLQNAGTKLKYLSEEEQLPRNFKVGAGYTVDVTGESEMQTAISLLADMNYLKDSGSYANVGLQFAAKYAEGGNFALRGGYRTNAESAAAVSLGLGISGASYVVDYAYSAMGDLGQVHRFSLSLKFGGGAV